MIIKSLPVHIYDVEVFKNIFHVCVYDTEKEQLHKFEISNRKDQSKEIVDYFNQNIMMAGYNNQHFDDIFIAYIEERHVINNATILCSELYKVSKFLIGKDPDYDTVKRWKYRFLDRSLDLMTLMFSNKLRVGLKDLQVTMHYDNVLEFTNDWDSPLDESRFDEMAEYNVNDVIATLKLLYICEESIKLRIEVENQYNVKVLSKDDVNLGMEILKQEYMRLTGLKWSDLKDLRSPMDTIPLKDVILPKIEYKHPVLQRMLLAMKEAIVSPERKGFEYPFILDGLEYNVGVGGIHTVNHPEMIVPKENEVLADWDVASLYPSLLLEYNFYPRHLGESFKVCYGEIRTKRLTAKRNKLKSIDGMFKLALNGLTGNLQNEYSWVYDPFAVMQIRINGQLLLLMLAERYIEAGATIIQANTDGLFIKHDKSISNKILEINKWWEEYTGLILEGENFSAFYQMAVNDYFAISDKGIKTKGLFIITTQLGKGLSPKIIPKAVINFFTKGIPIEDTIRNCTDIKDFLMAEKTGKQWEVIYNQVPQQQTNRFYASTNGAYLYKRKKTEGGYQYNNMLSDSGVTILNKFDDTSIENRKINYKYYIREAYNILTAIKPRQLSFW